MRQPSSLKDRSIWGLVGRSFDGGLPYPFTRILVFPQALEGSLPDHAVMGPTAELDLDHQLRLDPLYAPARHRRDLVCNGRRGNLDRRERLVERGCRLCGEAGTDAPDMKELGAV